MRFRYLLMTGVLGLFVAVGVRLGADEPDAMRIDDLVGTWEQSHQRSDGAAIRVMKIITPTHLAVFQQVRGKDRHSLQAHGGRHTLVRNEFVEHYEYSTNVKMLGTDGRAEMEIRNGKLYQRWKLADGRTATEIWTRAAAELPNAVAVIR